MWPVLLMLASLAVFAAAQGNSCSGKLFRSSAGESCLGKLSVGVDNVVTCPADCSAANATVRWCLSQPIDKCIESKSDKNLTFPGSSIIYVNEMGELIVCNIQSKSVISTNCTYLMGNNSICDSVSFNITQTLGQQELAPFPNFKDVLVNGETQPPSLSLYHVGVPLALCYRGNMFGFGGSPVWWEKNGEPFSKSLLINSTFYACNDYLEDIQSNPEVVRLEQRVQSFVNLYRSDPCLKYENSFIAILLIRSLQMSDTGVYNLDLKNLNQAALTDAGKSLDEIEYIKKEPSIAPLSQPYLEIEEGAANATVCYVNTSVGVNPVWLKPGETKVNNITTSCLDADCFCQSTSVNVSFVAITSEIHDSSEKALISHHKLILFICNADESLQGNYTCLVNSSESGFESVSMTLVLSVTPLDESSNQDLIISIVVVVTLLLLAMVILSIIAGCCLYARAYFRKSGEGRVVDLPIPGHLGHYYSSLPDTMEFPRDSLIQLELLGEGQFGQVFKAQAAGIVPGDNSRNIVAVKTVKENALNMDINDLYAELEIMKKMEPHPNILNLLGYCTRPFSDPPLIIMEFALHGNLKTFLRKYKQALFRLPSDASSQYSHSFNHSLTALSREHTPAPNSPVNLCPPHSIPQAIVLPTLVTTCRPPAQHAPLPMQSVTEYLEICGAEEATCSCEDGQECSCDAQRDGGDIPAYNQWSLYTNFPFGESTVLRHHLALDEPTYYNQTSNSDYQYRYQYQYQYQCQPTPYYNQPGPHQLYYNQSHAHSANAESGLGEANAEGKTDSVQQSPPAVSVCSCDWEGERSLFVVGPEADMQNGTQSEVESVRPRSQAVFATAPGGLRDIDFLNFALQISRGMEHLEKMKCLHRDLAARNVLIAEGFLLKIADFGLARELTDKDYYRKRTSGKLPARWMSIESLSSERIHTHKSDVWSFGVLLWEIFTYGSLPYGRGDVASTLESLLQHLVEGHRLPKPDQCSNDMYQVMCHCWSEDPAKRPSFSKLVLLFDHMLSAAHGYLQMSEEESMQTKASLDRLIDFRRRPSMELIVEESLSPNTSTITTHPPSSQPKHAPTGASTISSSRESNHGSNSPFNVSSTAVSSVANGHVVTGTIPLHNSAPLTTNFLETTV